MIEAIVIKERGPTPRGLARERRKAQKQAWLETGKEFHSRLMPKRFTLEGAAELGYTKRKGELMPRGSRGYRRSYTGRKERRFGHRLPMVYSGESRALARIRDVRATGNGARVVIHARKLNLRHPKSRVRMAQEIRRVSSAEAKLIGRWYDGRLDTQLNQINHSDEKAV